MSQEQLNVFDKLEGRMSPTTIKNFKRFFIKILEVANGTHAYYKDLDKPEELDIRTDSNKLIERIGEVYNKISTQRTMLKSILNFFQLKEESKSEHFQNYKNRIEEIETEVESKPKELTNRQKETDFESGLKKYLEFVESKDFDLSDEERSMLLYSFYVFLPPRRLDYVDMVYRKSFKNLEPETNYLIEGRKYWTFVFNKFKTSKGFKQQKFRITHPVLLQILKNMELRKDEQIYSSSLRTFQRRFKELSLRFFGKDLNVQDFRVLHSSEEFKDFADFINKIKEDSDFMSHQIGTKIKTYIRGLK